MYRVVKCSKTRLFCLAGNFALEDCLLLVVLHQYDIQVLSIERETWLFLFLCMTFMTTTDDAQFRQTIQMAPTILSSLRGAPWAHGSQGGFELLARQCYSYLHRRRNSACSTYNHLYPDHWIVRASLGTTTLPNAGRRWIEKAECPTPKLLWTTVPKSHKRLRIPSSLHLQAGKTGNMGSVCLMDLHIHLWLQFTRELNPPVTQSPSLRQPSTSSPSIIFVRFYLSVF